MLYGDYRKALAAARSNPDAPALQADLGQTRTAISFVVSSVTGAAPWEIALYDTSFSVPSACLKAHNPALYALGKRSRKAKGFTRLPYSAVPALMLDTPDPSGYNENTLKKEVAE